jgi:hypothetical protein
MTLFYFLKRTYNTRERTERKSGWRPFMAQPKEMKELPKILREDEKVEKVIQGFHEKGRNTCRD